MQTECISPIKQNNDQREDAVKIINDVEQKELCGENKGRHNTYFYRDKNKVFTSISLADLISQLQVQGHQFKISHRAISHLLHEGLVPFPYSIYENVYALGMGDKVNFYSNGDLKFSNHFPYDRALCRGDQTPSTEKLLNLLCQSITHCLGNKNAYLMMSSGKDSIGLALSIQRAGLENQVEAMTYANRENDFEAIYARKICDRLGIKHKTFFIPSDTSLIKKSMTRFFENSVQPVCDPVTPPYVLAFHDLEQGSVVLDGSGDDAYMGTICKKRNFHIYQCHLLTQNLRFLSSMIEPFAPFYSRTERLLKPLPIYQLLVGSLFLRHREVKSFFDGAVQTHAFWDRVVNEWMAKHSSSLKDVCCSFSYFLNFRNFFENHYYYENHILTMRDQVADAFNLELHLPWTNEIISNYYFHLPENEKYDLETCTNKLLLRKMLKEYLGHEEDKKRIFEFNLTQFLLENEAFVKEEILECKLWNKNITQFLNQIWPMVGKELGVRCSLMGLFYVSGWFNHSKWLKK